jgi:hypothetical protein
VRIVAQDPNFVTTISKVNSWNECNWRQLPEQHHWLLIIDAEGECVICAVQDNPDAIAGTDFPVATGMIRSRALMEIP